MCSVDIVEENSLKPSIMNVFQNKIIHRYYYTIFRRINFENKMFTRTCTTHLKNNNNYLNKMNLSTVMCNTITNALI